MEGQGPPFLFLKILGNFLLKNTVNTELYIENIAIN